MAKFKNDRMAALERSCFFLGLFCSQPDFGILLHQNYDYFVVLCQVAEIITEHYEK